MYERITCKNPRWVCRKHDNPLGGCKCMGQHRIVEIDCPGGFCTSAIERRIEKAEMKVNRLHARYTSLERDYRLTKQEYKQAVEALEELTEQLP